MVTVFSLKQKAISLPAYCGSGPMFHDGVVAVSVFRNHESGVQRIADVDDVQATREGVGANGVGASGRLADGDGGQLPKPL